MRRATLQRQLFEANSCISIHALLAESDLLQYFSLSYYKISIHALLAESDTRDPRLFKCSSISIHALLAESDRQNPGKHYVAFRFLSTLSLRRATNSAYGALDGASFLSTLSLRRATLSMLISLFCGCFDFYPRSPCGERPLLCLIFPLSPLFLSTLSLRRATAQGFSALHHIFISIHALLAESDRFQAVDISARRISIHALLAESDEHQ